MLVKVLDGVTTSAPDRPVPSARSLDRADQPSARIRGSSSVWERLLHVHPELRRTTGARSGPKPCTILSVASLMPVTSQGSLGSPFGGQVHDDQTSFCLLRASLRTAIRSLCTAKSK